MGDETSTSVPAQEQEPAVGAGSVKQQLSMLVLSSLRATVPEVEVEPMVEVSAKFADYQCNNAMGLWSKIKGSGTSFKNPNAIGQVCVCLSTFSLHRLGVGEFFRMIWN
jgi:arginyl-tRNA synthetase